MDVVNNDLLSRPSVSFEVAAPGQPQSPFKKPALKKRKMDAVELEMIAALTEKPYRHLSFFKGILPSLEDFDELDTLDFQMEVLKVIKKIRERKHPLPWRSKTPYDSPSSTPSMPSPSSTPPLVRNQYIHTTPAKFTAQRVGLPESN